MRNSNRIPEILTKIEKIWWRYPDLRFGQLIMNAMKMGEYLYYIEDDQLIKYLEEMYNENK
jgi:hypothetical protein